MKTNHNSRLETAQAPVSRRAVIQTGATLAAGIFSPAIVRAQQKTLVITQYGGVYETHFRKAVITPFEQMSGAKVIVKYGAPPEWLTSAIVNKDDPEIDVCILNLPTAMRAITTEDVFLDLPPERVPNALELDPLFYDLYNRKAVGFNHGPWGMGYRTDKIAPAPTSWRDLWNPKYTGKVLLPDITAGGAYEMIVIAAMLNGGSESNLEPGYTALKELKPRVLRFFKNNNEPIPMLTSGEASICAWYSARIYPLKDSGVPVEFFSPKEGAAVGTMSYHVAKKSRQLDLALQFTNFSLSRKPQEDFANSMEFGPTNKFAKLTGRAAQRVPSHSSLLRIDWRVLSPQLPKMAERWQREIVS